MRLGDCAGGGLRGVVVVRLDGGALYKVYAGYDATRSPDGTSQTLHAVALMSAPIHQAPHMQTNIKAL
jgi:hypothetical protein